MQRKRFASSAKRRPLWLLEKNAASQSRFAAALSQELNTPLGSLASTFETLTKLLEGVVERLENDEELERLFEPQFYVDGGRVATKNWSLFVSRSIMTEHGGRLDLEREAGAGTTATMRLPV